MQKGKVAGGIVLLILGCGLGVAGFLTNGYLQGQVTAGIPTVLSTIRTDVVPDIQADVYDQVPSTLGTVESGLVGTVTTAENPIVTANAISEVVDGVAAALPALVTEHETPSTLLTINSTLVGTIIAAEDPIVTANAISEVIAGLEAALPALVTEQETPSTLLTINATLVGMIIAAENPIITANVINTIINDVAGHIGQAAALDAYFNDPTFSTDTGVNLVLPGFSGISEQNGTGALGFSAASESFTLYGNATVPGWLSDLSLGSGVTHFLTTYESATTSAAQTAMATAWGASWGLLTALYCYLVLYMFASFVPTFAPTYLAGIGFATWPAYAQFLFYEQWANATLIPAGIGTLPGESALTGFEAGIPTATNLLTVQCQALWDPTSTSTFVNSAGLSSLWVPALSGDLTAIGNLESTFPFLSVGSNMTIMLTWLGNFMTNIFPILFEAQEGMTLAAYCIPLAWSYYFNDPTFSTDTGAPFEGISEQNGTGPLGFSTAAESFTLYGGSGIPGWLSDLSLGSGVTYFLTTYSSATTSAERTAMETTWSASWSQLTALYYYLVPYMFVTVVPLVVPSYLASQGYLTWSAYAQALFYEQWANATLIPAGIGTLPGESALTGFEAGLPTATGLIMTQCEDLWNPTSTSTFVNPTGLSTLWVPALSHNSAAIASLMTTFGLNTANMTMLLTWLGRFMNSIFPLLFEAQEHMTLAAYCIPLAWSYYFTDPTFSTDTGAPFMGIDEQIGTALSFSTQTENFTLYGNSSVSGWLSDLDLGSGVTYFLNTYASVTTLAAQAAMESAWGANWSTLTALYSYLENYMFSHIVPAVEPGYVASLGYSSWSAYSQSLFYTQWANGTVITAGVGTIEPALTGFEVGLPTATNLLATQCQGLWDSTSTSTFVNSTGFSSLWAPALSGNLTAISTLKSTFGLNAANMTMLLTWLGRFNSTIYPLLVQANYGMTIPDLSLALFYEQWANGTGLSLGPTGLGSVSSGLTGFEIGLPTATGLSLAQCQALWNENNPTSLLNSTGSAMWQSAASNPTGAMATLLQQAYGLTNTQMSAMLAWVPHFRTTVAAAESSEIKDVNTYGPYLQWGGLAVGIVLFVIGLVVLGLGFRKKVGSR
jgi:hypothetical protein